VYPISGVPVNSANKSNITTSELERHRDQKSTQKSEQENKLSMKKNDDGKNVDEGGEKARGEEKN
jgi:hypothetical protein